MKKPLLHFGFFTALFLQVFSVYASECFEASPNLNDESDETSYYALKTHSFNKTEEAFIQDLMEQISGEWQGRFNSTTCFGNEKNPSVKQRSASLEVEAESTRQGQLRLKAKKEFDDVSGYGVETLMLFDKNIISDFSVNNYSVEFIEKYRIDFQRPSTITTKAGKTVSTGVPGGKPLKEVIYQIDFSDDNWSLDIETYVNGYLAGKTSWSLDKKLY